MAAKRKAEDNDNENTSSTLPQKRHETTIEHDISTSYSTNSSFASQWYEQRGQWIALYDWNSGHYYYQNLGDYRTQWEKPPEWDSIHPLYIPISNYISEGFFKESANGYDIGSTVNNEEENYKLSASDIEAKVETFLRRPARRQMDLEESKKMHWIPEGATEYNIWYDRWVGEHWRSDKDHGPSETRCYLETDAGFTKANIYEPSGNKHYYCIYFARGCCHLGAECGYLHVIPTDKDEKRIDLAHDVFGRERHRLHKEDMGGVGTFDKECRTLYVGGLALRTKLEKLLWSEFGEWGEIEDLRVIPRRSIAFVRYKNRVNAEFAKIAMSDQKLNNRELLNVRWAFDDPNPRARKEELLRCKQKVLEAASERGLLQAALMRANARQGAQGTRPYPNTDNQYPVECGPMTKEQFDQAEVLQNVYNDCTRLDDALKRGESLLKEETPDNTTTTNTVTKINDYAQSNVSSSQTTYSDYWNNYYSTQADDYSSVGGSSQYDSTHEPYRETSEPVDEPIVQETTTS
ncbi:pre-mRNA-splicing factor cwc2-like isoform X1 [Acropora palmata]|uniref:pre-mRNA-splicing factor cwc2-like isoform X1 n=1 Tax=Acropora palmata TaxID=6131 RepID=UPI003DA0DBDE